MKFKKFLLFSLLSGLVLFTSPVLAEESAASWETRFFSPAVGLEANVMGFIPNYSLLIDFGMRFSSDITISPRVGFTYFMDIWDEIHDQFYFPVGVRINLPFHTAVGILYYLPLEGDFNRARFRISAGGERILYRGADFGLVLEAAMGAGLFFFYDTDETFFPMSFKLGLRVHF